MLFIQHVISRVLGSLLRDVERKGYQVQCACMCFGVFESVYLVCVYFECHSCLNYDRSVLFPDCSS